MFFFSVYLFISTLDVFLSFVPIFFFLEYLFIPNRTLRVILIFSGFVTPFFQVMFPYVIKWLRAARAVMSIAVLCAALCQVLLQLVVVILLSCLRFSNNILHIFSLITVLLGRSFVKTDSLLTFLWDHLQLRLVELLDEHRLVGFPILMPLHRFGVQAALWNLPWVEVALPFWGWGTEGSCHGHPMLGGHSFLKNLVELFFLFAQVFDRLDQQLLRLLGCLLVVALHLLSEFLFQWSNEPDQVPMLHF